MANSLKANVPPTGRVTAEEEIAGEIGEQTGGKAMDDTLEEPTEEEEHEEERKARAAAEEATSRDRAAQRQFMAIEEMVQTERNYLKHLQLCTVTIHNNLQKLQPPPPNLDNMFQHIDEVMDVSSRLLSLLDQSQILHINPKFLETLCDSFLSLSQDIEMAYKEYLANYNNITALENSYKQKETLWLEMVKIIKSSAPDVNASTLSFFLVMPVQRIARYPLLLQTIQKHTDPQHPAYSTLEHTVHTAVQINCRINEYKRFREVADKYKKTENLTIKDKINRLSGHSIAKKTARLSQYIKHETGMVPKLKDEGFDTLAGFFFVLERGVSELHDNMKAYLHHLQRFLSCRPEEADLDLEGEKAALFSKEITVALRQWIYPAYEKRLKTLVFKPLSSLRELMAGPRNLIRKRQDKLLDYELIEEKSNLNFEEQAIANTYKTMNTLLLTELPQFNGKALQLLWATLEAFSCLQRDLAADMEQLATSFTHQLPHSNLEAGEFWKWAECLVLEGSRRLESLCQSAQDDLNAPIVQALSPGSERRLKTLTAKHGSEKIYQLTGPVVGTRDLDLTLSKGELVAVVSEMDTRGERRRWLVDAGGPRGYVPASKLTRYHQVTVDLPPSPHLNVTPTGPGPRRHSYTPGAQPLLTIMTTPCFQVYAGYDFTARSSHELSLRAGEPVRVVEPHDKRGSKEWSLVEARGQRGYVPSNYLAVLPSVIASPTFPYC
ncbi:rho guanine nucleotide exchange factor 37-like [Myxocyprinus asiaticus]|uniref:rho guanine nucleotide exchange factor 37-like n=1 Tax=Myxocyprinus asiaticus TaxID=70543 RepID=UPI0022213109|nr:rho guanine nucleotide exchange factor 37-like [Myxocyprinus asiaticus]XP_051505865.1 rho guanine nucleotide exchange factor 37-like [Myxocyprinus asiaticus]XP_051505866.1 rho guanine nucleotide exchange factor 37-like [Myxocyprinus asiaticus]XP_051505869.1 rho guanine nucleotide exchange factor 37-like [Myxocyprinus asiaticus]XP_051505870.1 rho guanine nucleotide exchange factor 37-like [Myxocyprinus asiaticus]